jgi:hypothetical protein
VVGDRGREQDDEERPADDRHAENGEPEHVIALYRMIRPRKAS